ncbi:ANGP4 protein, partial [Pomatorhinus ruficollis]|nr:ANGP4 protein [Pomatorhinus ruficollis]
GRCSYTFVLPEADPPPCPAAPAPVPGPANVLLLRDSPAGTAGHGAAQRLRHLERILENSTQWLLKVGCRMRDVGDVCAGTSSGVVCGQGSVSSTHSRSIPVAQLWALCPSEHPGQLFSAGVQLVSGTVCTEGMRDGESNGSLQTHWDRSATPSPLHPTPSILEVRVLEMETKQQAELAGAHSEKEKLQRLLSRQSGTIEEMEKTLLAASANSSLLQRQQLQLIQSVQSLVRLVSQGRGERAMSPGQEQQFQDCAEVHRAGIHASGIYTLHIANLSEPKKVSTVQRASLQHPRVLPTQYTSPTTDPFPEQCWGLCDPLAASSDSGCVPAGHRLSLQDYSGTAGQQSGLALQGTQFSTRDADNDNCLCKCAQMLSGGWWFDACGLSNLNGIYYPARNNIRKLNGIRWHHFQGPSYSLKGTRMMIRPTSF